MSTTDIRAAERPEPDKIITDIVNYVMDYEVQSETAISTAHYCLLDSLACALLALQFPECVKHLGPVVPGATLSTGAKIPGTSHQLEPVQAAFNIGTLIRWLDFNDTWLAAEWGHPSDNLGAILAVADYLSRENLTNNKPPISIQDVLMAMIKAHEIQGVLALENSFNRVGLDHVILVRIASTAVVAHMLGCDRDEIRNAVSNAWIDGGALRTYRHAPNTGSRKSWAAGDACRRAVQLALMAKTGEMGYPSALTANTWGFYAVLFKDKSFKMQREYGSYVMENILFKLSFPAEFHAQTAVECAMTLHPEVQDRLSDIKRIDIETQEAGVRIIDKTGPLDNPADRDHCLQYMIAVPLAFGRLTADDYEDDIAELPIIDQLRDKMRVKENPQFTKDYFDPDKRAIGNSIQVHFNDGSSTDKISVDYPIGHRNRRKEGMPVLVDKFERAVADHYSSKQAAQIKAAVKNRGPMAAMSVNEFMDLWQL